MNKKYGVIGDAHLGFKAYDTEKRTKEGLLVFEQAVDILKDCPTICIPGDLIDDTSVPNWVKKEIIRIKEKYPEQVWVICGGNHDSTKTYSSVSTLDVLGEITNIEVVNSFEPIVVGTPNLSVLVIPHMRSQEKFLNAIDYWLSEPFTWDVILMHCMVHSGLDLSPNDLNIDMYRLEQLAKQADQIWIGHEHSPKLILPNVRIPGGTMEFDFGQLGTKYVYIVDGDIQQIPLTQSRPLKQIDMVYEGPVDILNLVLDESTIYKLVISGIATEDYSTARLAVDTVEGRFNGDLIHNLIRTDHKELAVTTIDARFDLLEEFDEFATSNNIADRDLMKSRLEDAVSQILAEEEENL